MVNIKTGKEALFMDELNIKPINNVDVEESGDAGIQICIVKCKGDTCDSCDGICFMG